ncbi:MAG TPA: NAD(+)/NADH kinase [Chloroflexota bacterium]|nr:NAD(+)/NADH kinase [Chloroflexota bacterium]
MTAAERGRTSSGRVALVYQPAVEKAVPLVERCVTHLEAWGRDSLVLSVRELESKPLVDGVELVVTFGGDGTILRAARWLGGWAIPIVGVQMGRLGFLAELLPKDLPTALEPYVRGDYWVDRRAMLRAEVIDAGAVDPCSNTLSSPLAHIALNDVVVGRGQSLRTVTVDLVMEGRPLHSFRCDGVIVATATGSTAYSFAAGGPVLAPESADLVVTAICPHITSLKTLVLPGDVPLRLQVWTTQPAVITVDGQVDELLGDGAIVDARRGDETTLFARRGARGDLYSRILSKLD